MAVTILVEHTVQRNGWRSNQDGVVRTFHLGT